MSTRAILMVTGQNEYRNGPQTVRVYKHSDGYPSWVLRLLIRATELAEELLTSDYNQHIAKDHLDDLSAQAFADCFIAASLGHRGFEARVDTNDEQKRTPAIYHDRLKSSHYGRQSDLEWVYVVDLKKRSVKVYGGGYDDCAPQVFVRRGTVDPRREAGQMTDEYRDRYLGRICAALDRLQEQGWTVNNGLREEVKA